MAARLAITLGVLLAGTMITQSDPQLESRKTLISAENAAKDAALQRSVSGGKTLRIESIEPDRAKGPAKEVAWLGVSTEEASDALGAQLGLKSGEGLVVVYVAPDSPASNAGIKKHDVLVELGDQLLVHPLQLRKLVQTKNEGDTVNLTLYQIGRAS